MSQNGQPGYFTPSDSDEAPQVPQSAVGPMTPQPMTPQPGPMTPQPRPITPPAEQPSANSQQGADEQNDMDWIPEPEAVMEPQLHPLWHRVYQNTHKIPEQFKRELLVEQRRTAIQHVAMYIVTDRQRLLLQNAYGWLQSLGEVSGLLLYVTKLTRVGVKPSGKATSHATHQVSCVSHHLLW